MYSYKETDVFQFLIVHRLFWKDMMPHKFMHLLSLKDTFPGPLSCSVLDQLYLPITMTLHGIRQWHPTPVLLPGKSHG